MHAATSRAAAGSRWAERPVEAFVALLFASALALPARAQTVGFDWNALYEQLQVLDQGGDYQAALDLALMTIDERRAAGDLYAGAESYLLYHAADKSRALRDFELAFELVARAEMLLDDSDYGLTQRCQLAGLRGWIHLSQGQLDRAEVAFALERSRLDELESKGLDTRGARADHHRHLAALAMARGEPAAVLALLDELERSAQGAGEDARSRAFAGGQRSYLRLRLAGAEVEAARLGRGDFERARAALESAFELAEPGSDDRSKAALWSARLELDLGQPERARSFLRDQGSLRSGGSGPHPDARSWSILAARLALLDGERGAIEDARAALTSELERFIATWRPLAPTEGGYGLLHYDDRLALLYTLTELEVALRGPVEGARVALENLLRVRALGSLDQELGVRADPERVRAALLTQPSDGLIIFLPGRSVSYAFALDREELTLHQLANQFVLERARRDLVAELFLGLSGAGDAQGARRASRALSELLLPDTLRARMRDWDSIGVSGLDLFLGELPFESLELEDGQAIGVAKAVYALPSLHVGVALAERGPARVEFRGVVLLGAPDVPASTASEHRLDELPFATAELERLLEPWSGEGLLIEGPWATLAALERGEVRSASLLQVLAHGVSLASEPRPARIALAPLAEGDDGLVGARELEAIYAQRDAPDLVLLTVCRAARGPRRRGDAAAGHLAGAFLARGSRAVVASAFDLDAEVAARLSRSMHEALGTGSTVAEAARRARAELAGDARFAHPAHGALVRVVGLGAARARSAGARPSQDASRSRAQVRAPWPALVTASIVALLLLGALAMARRRP